MGEFANGPVMKWFSTVASAIIIGINMFFVGGFVSSELPHEWWVYLIVALLGAVYVSFIAYLCVYLVICLGWESLVDLPWVRKYFYVEDFVQQREKEKKAMKKF